MSRQSSRVRDGQIDAIGIKYVGPVQSGIAFLVEREGEYYLWSMGSWDIFFTVLALSILERRSRRNRKEGSNIVFVYYALDIVCYYIRFILAFRMA